MSDQYDPLAKYYREIAKGREVYLDGVDKLIIEQMEGKARSMLDVGAGDGVRGMELAEKLGAKRVVLSEPSKEMAKLCREKKPNEVWEVKAEELPKDGERFDLIICLWNVLGIVGTSLGRVEALRRMRGLLDDEGRLFLDVNNRYNIRDYGWRRVLGNMIKDVWRGDNSQWDVSFMWRIGGVEVAGMGHLFSPGEMRELIRAANLKVERKWGMGYKDGKIFDSLLKGQLVYKLRR